MIKYRANAMEQMLDLSFVLIDGCKRDGRKDGF